MELCQPSLAIAQVALSETSVKLSLAKSQPWGEFAYAQFTGQIIVQCVTRKENLTHLLLVLLCASRDCCVFALSLPCVTVCGDNICELEESCLNCPADCGVCPMSMSIKVAIGLPVTLFFSGFILTIMVRRRPAFGSLTPLKSLFCFHQRHFV